MSEETGLEVEVLDTLGTIQYWFVRGGVRFHKTVHHFLMRPTGGSTDRHDQEYDIVRWFPLPDAMKALSHDNEKEVVRQAAEKADRMAIAW